MFPDCEEEKTERELLERELKALALKYGLERVLQFTKELGTIHLADIVRAQLIARRLSLTSEMGPTCKIPAIKEWRNNERLHSLWVSKAVVEYALALNAAEDVARDMAREAKGQFEFAMREKGFAYSL